MTLGVEIGEINVKHIKMPQLLQGLWFTKYKLYKQLMSCRQFVCFADSETNKLIDYSSK